MQQQSYGSVLLETVPVPGYSPDVDGINTDVICPPKQCSIKRVAWPAGGILITLFVCVVAFLLAGRPPLFYFSPAALVILWCGVYFIRGVSVEKFKMKFNKNSRRWTFEASYPFLKLFTEGTIREGSFDELKCVRVIGLNVGFELTDGSLLPLIPPGKRRTETTDDKAHAHLIALQAYHEHLRFCNHHS
eukprot:PhM_4_TR11900/c0_g2_i1/m.27184